MKKIVFLLLLSYCGFSQEKITVFKRNELESFYKYIDDNFNKTLIKEKLTVPFIIYVNEKSEVFDLVFSNEVDSTISNELKRIILNNISFDMSDQTNPFILKRTVNLFLNTNEKIKGAAQTSWYNKESFEKQNIDKEPKIISNDLLAKYNNEQNSTNLYSLVGVEVRPEYPGGIGEFYKYIGKKFRVPNVKGLEGKIVVAFVVEKDGSINDIKVLKDIGYGTKEEAIRVLKNCKNWKPAEQDGKKVRCSYALPISITAP